MTDDRQAARAPGAVVSAAAMAPLASRSSRKIKLLLVDGDDTDRAILRRLLEASGFAAHIEEASSGHEAIDRLRKDRFDCMVVDYWLRDMTGTDLLRRIKEASALPLATLMVTECHDERVVVEAMREGVYDYLTKKRLTPRNLACAIEGGLRWAELEAELADAQERLQRLSMFDSLTKLANRNLFFDRLEQTLQASRRSELGFSLMMMDLNLFKAINDDLGHHAGDRLLAEIGRRLSNLARVSDTFARIGGDEFAALLVGCDSTASATVVAEKIQAALNEPMLLDGELVRVTVSIGVVIFPHHGHDVRTLLAHADEAMYVAKRSSRTCEIYSAVPNEARPFLMANHLAGAVERGELFLEYQPKLHLGTGALAGVEALVRWRSPQLGLVTPNDFIPIAERTSLIPPMTYAILDMALDQVVRWRASGWQVPVAVNLSARMFDDDELVARCRRALERRGLGPEILTLEVTETALMTSPLGAQRALRALRDAGLAISIDDFGAGYTSLRYLREFDISEIKIDKLFVTSLKTASRDASIVRSIAALSRGFDVKLVAEGIEDPGQCGLLHELGCDYGQGFALGRPMSVEELEGWRAARPRHAEEPPFPASGIHSLLPPLGEALGESAAK